MCAGPGTPVDIMGAGDPITGGPPDIGGTGCGGLWDLDVVPPEVMCPGTGSGSLAGPWALDIVCTGLGDLDLAPRLPAPPLGSTSKTMGIPVARLAPMAR